MIDKLLYLGSAREGGTRGYSGSAGERACAG
jgi:hypothetical protein